MKEKSIIFTADEVRATLAGRMTQVRRVVKPQPSGMLEWKDVACSSEPVFKECMKIYCPFSQPGGRLWVKETFWKGPQQDRIEYDADMDADAINAAEIYGAKKKPSPKMPRWASRITLEKTRIRVERVQDITEQDAIAEGVKPILVPPDGGSFPYVACFIERWNAQNEKKGNGWNKNPWVWVIDFKLVEVKA